MNSRSRCAEHNTQTGDSRKTIGGPCIPWVTFAGSLHWRWFSAPGGKPVGALEAAPGGSMGRIPGKLRVQSRSVSSGELLETTHDKSNLKRRGNQEKLPCEETDANNDSQHPKKSYVLIGSKK